jgi:PilZ domain-containing protein
MFKTERRKRLRFNMSLPISVGDDSAGIQIQGMTRDVGSSGVSFFSTIELAVGTAVTFALELPFEVTLTEPVRVDCKGHVVRFESRPDGRPSVMALHLDRFAFVGFRENAQG